MPTSLSSSELSSHQMAPAGSLMGQGRMRLVTTRPLHMRPHSGSGEEERGLRRRRGGGATVQKSVGIPVMDVLMLFSDKFQQSTSSKVASGSVHPLFVGPFLSCSRDVCPQCKLCRKPVFVQRQASGCSQCKQLWSSTVAVLWQSGRRLGERKAVCSCFQTGGRSSSHR